MKDIKTVLGSQVGNSMTKGNSDVGGSSRDHTCDTQTMCQNSNTRGHAGGLGIQGTLAAAARIGSNGYKK